MNKILNQLSKNLKVKGRSFGTEKQYLYHVGHFLKYVKKTESFKSDDIFNYQYFISEKLNYSTNYYNQCSAALRFFFKFIIKEKVNYEKIAVKKKEKKLPVVLNKNEILKIFNAAWNIRYKAILYTIYSAGFRVSELVNIKLKHIDSERMVIHIHESKFKKDRIVFLSPTLLKILREYYRKTYKKPMVYLFEGVKPGKPMCRKSINYIIKRVVERTDIEKNVTVHTLRHTFATHLLENGVNLRTIQVLLGHSDITTTTIYMHVARNLISRVKSPLDVLLDDSKKEEK